MFHRYNVYSQVFDIKGKEHIKAARYKYLTFTMLSQMHESNAIDLIDIPITVGAMAYVINALSYIVTWLRACYFIQRAIFCIIKLTQNIHTNNLIKNDNISRGEININLSWGNA